MTTLLIAEHDHETLKDSTNKALTAASQLGGDVHVLVAGGGQRANAAAVEAVGEAHDGLAPGDLAGQLQRGLDRVGAGRAGELHAVVAHAARLEDQPVEGFEETLLGFGVHVQAVGDAVVLDVLQQRRLEYRIVVAVVQ